MPTNAYLFPNSHYQRWKLPGQTPQMGKDTNAMRRAQPDECLIHLYPVFLAELSEADLKKLFPVELSEAEPFTEPEPSVGGLVQLENGQYFGIVFGLQTQRLAILKPEGQPTREMLTHLFQAVPELSNFTTWKEKS